MLLSQAYSNFAPVCICNNTTTFLVLYIYIFFLFSLHKTFFQYYSRAPYTHRHPPNLTKILLLSALSGVLVLGLWPLTGHWLTIRVHWHRLSKAEQAFSIHYLWELSDRLVWGIVGLTALRALKSWEMLKFMQMRGEKHQAVCEDSDGCHKRFKICKYRWRFWRIQCLKHIVTYSYI